MALDLAIISISSDDSEGLRTTLESIARQHAPVRQVIVVRRGSSLELDVAAFPLENLQEAADPGRGISSAFNAGLSLVRTAWVMFLNGGDALLDEGALARLYAFAEEASPETELISGFARSRGGVRVPHRAPTAADDFLYLSHQASIFRSRLFADLGGYRDDFLVRMDLDWLARYATERGNARIAFSNADYVLYELDGISSHDWFHFHGEELKVLVRQPVRLRRLLTMLLIDIPARAASPKAWPRRARRLWRRLARTPR